VRIYILGITGMLGSQLFTKFVTDKKFIVRGSTRKKKLSIFKNYNNHIDFQVTLNENNYNFFKKKIANFKPDWIINCIGIVKQEINHKSDLANILFINSVFPHKLQAIANSINAKLLHFSTDCVFDGKKGGYYENCIPNAQDIYGVSKILGELNSCNGVTIRTSIIGYEYYKKKGLIEWFLSKKITCNGFVNAFFSGVTTLEVYNFLTKYFFKKNFSGLIHLHSKKISKYELLIKIKKLCKIKIKINKTRKFKIDRSLKSKYLKNIFFYKSPTWNQMLKDTLKSKKLI
jgi:dTDP-4-dehydrorhamnose reductase